MICVCKNCNKEFKRKPNTFGLYCSNKCSHEYKNRESNSMVERTCEECGENFIIKRSVLNNKHLTNPGKYCSRVCKDKANATGPTLAKYTCKHCGKEFERGPAHVKDPENVYCSVKCRGEGRKARFEHTCLQCGKKFEVQKAQHENGDGKFCSKECHSDSMKILPDVECICQNCGKTFIETGIRVQEGKGKFCSKGCIQVHRERTCEYVEIECEICHQKFTVLKSSLRRWNIKHCSNECRAVEKDLWRKSRQTRCLHCNKVFIPRLSDIRNGGGKYCSKKCVDADHAPVKLKCLVCGTDFQVPPSTYKIQSTKYCSHKCSIIGKTKLVESECQFCHKKFMARPRRLAMGGDRFCSKTCSGAYNHSIRSVDVNCKYCGKPFSVKQSLLAMGSGKYCSRACQNAAPRATGPNHKLWTGGKIRSYGPDWYRQRNAAYNRDKGICQSCFRPKGEKERCFHVHHIVKRRSFKTDYKSANALSNLITLCPKCHRAVENGKNPCPKPKKTTKIRPLYNKKYRGNSPYI